MPPRQEKRGRGRGKRPRNEEELSPSTSQTSVFSALNSPSTGSTPRARVSQQSQVLSSSPRNVASKPGPSTQQSIPLGPVAPPGKVAIPALKHPRTSESSKALKKGRTPHACDFCRKAKAGCTGGNPCTRCLNANVPCVYGDGKRDKDKKRMTRLSRESISLSRHNDDVTEALRRIRLDTNLSSEDIRAALDEVISMAPTPVTPDEDESALRESRESSEADEEDQISGNEDLDMEVGSTGSLDVTNMNTDRDDTRAIGHMGKSSSVAWAKRTADACQPPTEAASISGKSQPALVMGSYHTEDADVEFFDTSNINCFDWPEPEVADALVQSYFDTVHPALPIVDKINFMSQYNQFDRTSVNLSIEDVIWLGTLNTIFAISAVHAHLTRSRIRGHYCDHLIYLARAKTLCLDQGLLYEDARVHTTSALGLLCLYFVSTCRLNRAWTVCGLAIRHALTLGLHVRSEADDLSDYDKENRVRLWWSLYSLECLLNELTGRPSCISDRDISTPLPINIDEEEFRPGKRLYNPLDDTRYTSGHSSRRGSRGSKDLKRRPSATYQMPIGVTQPLAYTFPVLTLPTTTSTYFIYRTQLTIISHEIVTQLYCAATIKEKWVEVQETINGIDSRLRSWRDSLPAEYTLDFDRWNEPDWNDPYVLPRMGLAMLFNSSRMILFRPCLCKFEGRMSTQSEKSMDFNREGVQMCIHSARTMINLIGWTARNVERLYAVTPWWHTLHYLCEALSVLMLELAYLAQHLPTEAGDILDDAKKGIRWLIMMSEESISARKAWEIFDSLVRVVAPRINWSVFDLPTTAPVPLGYNWRSWSGLPGNADQQQIPQSSTTQFAALDPQLDPNSRTQVSSSSATPWAHPTFGYQPSHTYAPIIYGQELVSNPLDQNQAIQMFGSIGALHGHYDEPWHHVFGVTEPGAVSGIQSGTSFMGPPLPPENTMTEQNPENLFTGNIDTEQFAPGYGPYEGMSGRSTGAGFP
ncbi:fungal-specific transcription factor domain-containing protein [Rhexocercosporidium sp. MPI-PUGE-AT-0058]|nr:fungal-specific transcription factor domain-containing protein [Rhexocercosporidium sp. MPI-PUGE-AT-0058]